METVSIVFGGIGLFLLGMMIMTDGLKSIAGNSLKQLLSKFTKGTFSSILTGMGVTAVIQSSSATSLMTVGFVSAGLLSFAQSVGVIIGANLGSTSIGWIVSAIGFKVSMGVLAMPLIGIGAFLRFVSTGRFAAHGMALAGFGLLFLGIDVLQNGMSSLTSIFSLDFLGEPAWWQMLLLVLVGLVMTVILQSSSTAFVITLSAALANTVTFEQAAAIVIGQNIGTTIKVYFASLQGTVPAKRTALTHVWFNLFTGLLAFLFLPWLIPAVFTLGAWFHVADVAILLSLFNSLIYVLAILVLWPFLPQFTRFIARLAPDRSENLVKHLDDTVAAVPAVAIEAARRTLIEVTKVISETGAQLFSTKTFTPKMQSRLVSASSALQKTREFLALIEHEAVLSSSKEYRQQIDLVHIIDHLERLIRALSEEESTEYLKGYAHVQAPQESMLGLFKLIKQALTYGDLQELVQLAQDVSITIAALRRKNRKEIFAKSVERPAKLDLAIEEVHALHWVDRVAYHSWRSLHYIQQCAFSEEEVSVDI